MSGLGLEKNVGKRAKSLPVRILLVTGKEFAWAKQPEIGKKFAQSKDVSFGTKSFDSRLRNPSAGEKLGRKIGKSLPVKILSETGKETETIRTQNQGSCAQM